MKNAVKPPQGTRVKPHRDVVAKRALHSLILGLSVVDYSQKNPHKSTKTSAMASKLPSPSLSHIFPCKPLSFVFYQLKNPTSAVK